MLTLRSLPNLLGLLRILGTPIVMGFILLNSTAGYFWAATIFTLLVISDVIDGKLARSLNAESTLGVFLDTISDKVLVTGALIPMIQNGVLSGWIGLIILGREFIISGLRAYATTCGEVIAAGKWGKQKFTLTAIAIIWRLLCASAELAGLPVGWTAGGLGFVLSLWFVPMALAVVWTILSGIDYIWKAWPLLRQGWTPSPPQSVNESH